MGRQRRILDLLAERGRLCIETIARELGEDPDRIKARVLKMRYRGLVRVITHSASLDGALIELALPALVRKVHGDAA
jgi:DNA-binding Lrp family transcriptional regulator